MRRFREIWRDRQEARLLSRSDAFDAKWYFDHNSDVADRGLDPLRHYLSSGGAEGRSPHALFDGKWYADTYLGGIPARCNPLVHYLSQADFGSNRPNPWFDTETYKSCVGAPFDASCAMVHYQTVGASAGMEPNAIFQTQVLTARHPGLGGHRTPLAFYIHDYRITACVGALTSYFISGWASRTCDVTTMILSILVNGAPCGQVTPWIARPDVEAATGRVGLGFMFRFPIRLAHGDVVELQDEFAQTVAHYRGHETFGACALTYQVPDLDASSDLYLNRAAIAAAFLTGKGVEIGAFTQPTDLPPDCSVSFYDRFSAEALRGFYDETCHRPLMEPTYIGNAETVDGLPNAAFDFLIANHVIEHLEDPIRFLKNGAEKLIEGGRMMIAAADKRFSFDSRRALTTFDHLVDDHDEGPARSKRTHLLEWAVFVIDLGGSAALAWGTSVTDDEMPIHYHVWDADSFVAFVEAAIDRYCLPLALEYKRGAANEIIVILRKVPSRRGAALMQGTARRLDAAAGAPSVHERHA